MSGMGSSSEAFTQVPLVLLGSVSDGCSSLESYSAVSVGSSSALAINTLGLPLVEMWWNGEEGNFWEEEGPFSPAMSLDWVSSDSPPVVVHKGGVDATVLFLFIGFLVFFPGLDECVS